MFDQSSCAATVRGVGVWCVANCGLTASPRIRVVVLESVWKLQLLRRLSARLQRLQSTGLPAQARFALGAGGRTSHRKSSFQSARLGAPVTLLLRKLIRCSRRTNGLPRRPVRAGAQFITWLILPVVICLSQRLSHACLSISFSTAKLRMAH